MVASYSNIIHHACYQSQQKTLRHCSHAMQSCWGRLISSSSFFQLRHVELAWDHTEPVNKTPSGKISVSWHQQGYACFWPVETTLPARVPHADSKQKLKQQLVSQIELPSCHPCAALAASRGVCWPEEHRRWLQHLGVPAKLCGSTPQPDTRTPANLFFQFLFCYHDC